MKKLALACAFALTFAGGAASADTIENGFGNTFVVTPAGGPALSYHFEPDHTYTFTTADGAPASGAWEIADGQLCLTPAGGERACNPYDGDKNVGDTWTMTGADGAQTTITLNAGR